MLPNRSGIRGERLRQQDDSATVLRFGGNAALLRVRDDPVGGQRGSGARGHGNPEI